MPSSTKDVSVTLGDYMLRGWVLTDKSCPTLGCAIPLLRSPNGKSPVSYFCANCDLPPQASVVSPLMDPSSSTSNVVSSSSLSSESHNSRSSTPPTEVSDALSSPVFAPPAETEESIRRREQSDRASSEIGKKLLQGWAMLAEECPNASCFGVPLVRPPQVGGEKSSRKECVICGNMYTTEVDWSGRERLVPASAGAPQVNNATMPTQAENTFHRTTSEMPSSFVRVQKPDAFSSRTPIDSTPTSSTTATLDNSARVLENTLQLLSTRLASATSAPFSIEPASIGAIADAITKVTSALSQVKQLQWSEMHSNL